MQTSYRELQDIYERQLHNISSIHFTHREIDIISCIINNRSEKKIAALLAISPRTVSSHVHNVMLKVGCNSKDYVIDFIEKSGKLKIFKQYYLHLLIQSLFIRQLNKINYYTKEIKITYNFESGNVDDTCITQTLGYITKHLKLAGISNTLNLNDDNLQNHYTLRIVSNTSVLRTVGNEVFISFNDDIKLSDEHHVSFSNEHQYYASLLNLIKIITDLDEVKEIIKEFDVEYQAIFSAIEIENNNSSISKKKKYLTISIIFVILIVAIITVLVPIKSNMYQDKPLAEDIQSELVLPQTNAMLLRPDIIEQIDKKFLQDCDIPVVVLTGIGGAGKTTVARYYARQQKASIIWEINAESVETIFLSLIKLAYYMCNTLEERNEVKFIEEMQDEKLKHDKLQSFLSKSAKKYSNWFLVYDNVKMFNHIRKYIPYDSRIWGNGKILITTRDSNIANSSFIKADTIVSLKELTKQEKDSLFNKIVTENINDKKILSEKNALLDILPPYPLDIVTAAYYIKVNKISFSKYNEAITTQGEKISALQSELLRDIGGYTNTRYQIVTLSIQSIINSNPEFMDLLLLISMIDSNNIPKDLLLAYKDEFVVNKLLNELKKVSIIADDDTSNDAVIFSIHRSIQAIVLVYLLKSIQLDNHLDYIQNISNTFEDYMSFELETQNIDKMSALVSHVETFFSHNQPINHKVYAKLQSKLGIYYFYLGNYSKARGLLEDALVKYQKYYGVSHTNTAQIMTYLSIVYRNMEEYSNARRILHNAYNIYKQNHGKSNLDTIWVSVYLASVDINLGNYQKAKKLLEYAYIKYKEYYGADNIKTAWIGGYLGVTYTHLGEWQEAKKLMEQNCLIYSNFYGINHIKTAWMFVRLGNIYRHLGYYNKAIEYYSSALETYKSIYGPNHFTVAWTTVHLGRVFYMLKQYVKAKELLEQAIVKYSNLLPEKHTTTAWANVQLASIYFDLKEYRKAKKLLEESLILYQEFYGKYHIKTAKILMILGHLHYKEGDIPKSESVLNEAAKIFGQSAHPAYCQCKEKLADLYTIQYKNEKNTKLRLKYRQQAKACLLESLNVIQRTLPGDSKHKRTIQEKINKMDYHEPIQK